MQKRHVGWILSIVLLPTLCFGGCKCNQKKNPVQPPVQVQAPAPAPVQAPVVRPVLTEGRIWVNKMTVQYPEIVWLANAHVRQTGEGQAAADKPYSEQLYNQKFIEFDHSLMSLYCLKLILDGSDQAYQEFTAAQPENVRLIRESFQQLHQQGKSLLDSNYQDLSPLQMQQAMETALVLGNLGKSQRARDVFKALRSYSSRS